jgi:hypothetical protein
MTATVDMHGEGVTDRRVHAGVNTLSCHAGCGVTDTRASPGATITRHPPLLCYRCGQPIAGDVYMVYGRTGLHVEDTVLYLWGGPARPLCGECFQTGNGRCARRAGYRRRGRKSGEKLPNPGEWTGLADGPGCSHDSPKRASCRGCGRVLVANRSWRSWYCTPA